MPQEFNGDFDEWLALLRHFFPVTPANATHIDFIEYDIGMPYELADPPTLHADAYWNIHHLSRWVGTSRTSTPVNWTGRERRFHNCQDTAHRIPDFVDHEVHYIPSRRF